MIMDTTTVDYFKFVMSIFHEFSKNSRNCIYLQCFEFVTCVPCEFKLCIKKKPCCKKNANHPILLAG